MKCRWLKPGRLLVGREQESPARPEGRDYLPPRTPRHWYESYGGEEAACRRSPAYVRQAGWFARGDVVGEGVARNILQEGLAVDVVGGQKLFPLSSVPYL